MKDDDYKFVRKTTNTMINKGIDEVARSNRDEHSFRIHDDEIKAETNRTRLRPEIRDQIIGEFENAGLQAKYDPKSKITHIKLDVSEASLNPAQTENLMVARNYYRVVTSG